MIYNQFLLKTSKFKMFSLLSIFMMFIASFLIPNNIQAELPCYDPLPNDMTCGEWIPVEVTRTFPLTYSCYVTVKYSYRECTRSGCDKTIIQYNFGSIDIRDDELICSGLMTELFPGYPLNFSYMNQGKFNDLIDQIFLTIGKEKFLENPTHCDGEPPPCDLPTGCQFEIYYSNPKCRAYCVQISDVLPAGYRNSVITPINCLSETPIACCKHTKLYCLCGTEVLVREYDDYSIGDCDVEEEPELQCPNLGGNWQRWFIECSSNCE